MSLEDSSQAPREIRQPMTLDDCAHCVQQLNADLQTQTNAYRYFIKARNTIAQHAEGQKTTERLPFVTFNFANGKDVGLFKLDLMDVPAAQLAAVLPLYDSLTELVGERLLEAWRRLIDVVQKAAQQVSDAEYSEATEHAG